MIFLRDHISLRIALKGVPKPPRSWKRIEHEHDKIPPLDKLTTWINIYDPDDQFQYLADLTHPIPYLNGFKNNYGFSPLLKAVWSSIRYYQTKALLWLQDQAGLENQLPAFYHQIHNWDLKDGDGLSEHWEQNVPDEFLDWSLKQDFKDDCLRLAFCLRHGGPRAQAQAEAEKIKLIEPPCKQQCLMLFDAAVNSRCHWSLLFIQRTFPDLFMNTWNGKTALISNNLSSLICIIFYVRSETWRYFWPSSSALLKDSDKNWTNVFQAAANYNCISFFQEHGLPKVTVNLQDPKNRALLETAINSARRRHVDLCEILLQALIPFSDSRWDHLRSMEYKDNLSIRSIQCWLASQDMNWQHMDAPILATSMIDGIEYAQRQNQFVLFSPKIRTMFIINTLVYDEFRRIENIMTDQDIKNVLNIWTLGVTAEMTKFTYQRLTSVPLKMWKKYPIIAKQMDDKFWTSLINVYVSRDYGEELDQIFAEPALAHWKTYFMTNLEFRKEARGKRSITALLKGL